MKKKIQILNIALTILFSFFIASPVDAVVGKRIQISPTNSETFELEGGDVETGSFEVRNTGSEAFTFKFEIVPFSTDDESYSLNYETETNYTKISNWITCVADKNTLEPGESTTAHYTITTPHDAPGGGQYAAITTSVVQENVDKGNINIVARVAYIVYARVDGETRLEGSVLENNIPGFFLGSPISVSSLVENTGNIDFEAKYNFEVMEAFSDEEVYSNTDQEITYRILPETKRFINFSWDGSPQLGLFRVRQTVTVNDDISVSEKLVFLCPVWLLFLVIFGVIFMIIWLFVRSRARRKQL